MSSLILTTPIKVFLHKDSRFLLAKLHIETVIAKHSVQQVRAAINSLPSGLDATYDVAMERIKMQRVEDQELAMRRPLLGYLLKATTYRNRIAARTGNRDWLQPV
ncbi:hypothetical protein BDZ91DRAFT_768109 [Kalaharituber pfeilii]|nr:hypothetical protein BDZ91DRAFT_768109 [Kalaharituber pfeilii]